MLNRRRQSVVGSSGGFARAPSPSKGYAAFSRSTASREGRPSPSPRASSNNLRGSNPDNRLSSLAETSPTAPETPSRVRGDTNGTSDNVLIADLIAGGSSPSAVNGTSKPLPDLSDVQPPPGPPQISSITALTPRLNLILKASLYRRLVMIRLPRLKQKQLRRLNNKPLNWISKTRPSERTTRLLKLLYQMLQTPFVLLPLPDQAESKALFVVGETLETQCISHRPIPLT